MASNWCQAGGCYVQIDIIVELHMSEAIDILCVDKTKLDSSYPDAQFQINDYQFSSFRRDTNKYGRVKIV